MITWCTQRPVIGCCSCLLFYKRKQTIELKLEIYVAPAAQHIIRQSLAFQLFS